jgi:hypothetical protein
MKTLLRQTCFVLLFIIGILPSCKKGGIPPTVETSPVTNVTAFSATCGGTVTDGGSSPITAYGVCWAAKLNPTVQDLKTEDGAGTGTFISNIAGLYAGVSYFVRAYATNSAGTSYGTTRSFIPSGKSPSATAYAATNVKDTSATLNGFVESNSFITTVTFQYGTNTNYENSVPADRGPLAEDEAGDVSAEIRGLTPSTTYYYRVVATNSLGTTFSNSISFKTPRAKGGK